MITIDTIKAARDGDFEATAEIIADMSARIDGVASRAASRRRYDYATLCDEYRQVANIALWEKVNDTTADDVDAFYAAAYRHIESRVKDAARDNAGGVSTDHLAAFGKAVERADGDLTLAVQLAQIHPYSTRGRMSADSAHAACLAWQGNIHVSFQTGEIDLPSEDDESTIDAATNTPNKIKAAFRTLEEHITVSRDADELLRACDMLSRGVVSESILDAVSENIHIPKNRKARLFVLGAFGILAAAVRSSEHSATPVNEYDDQEDENPSAREHIARAQTVRAILGQMSDLQSSVLKHSFGIGGSTLYGQGDAGDDYGMAAETGIDVTKIPDIRKKGKLSFAKRWIKAMCVSDRHASVMEEAAANQRKRGGRK